MTFVKNILVPTDFSHNSSNAVNYSCDLARSTQSRLHLLNVTKDQLDSGQREKALERLGQAIDARSELELETIKSVVVGTPGTEIVDYARQHNVDLIVMGTHGRTGLAHLAMGSVTESVLKNSPCPVTVLGPHEGEDATLPQAIKIVEQVIGKGLHGEDEGRGKMLKALVSELRITSTSAILMFDELENRGWVKWEKGHWLVTVGDEILDKIDPFPIQSAPDTQAMDLIKRAKKLAATDIHLDPSGVVEYVVRLRIDGNLREYCRLDRSVGEHLINQYKNLAKIDHSEPFHAHEGRVQLPQHLRDLEVRFTSVPVPEGQAVSLRILDPNNVFRPLGELGLSTAALESVQEMLRQGEGLILVTGPTGSGKTTTVYSMLETIGGKERNIVSIEDPVEFMAPFVRQIKVDDRHGLSMANGLRTLLRMDPDVLFIGEIRDPETAAIGFRAASSGRYVLSTLHTRDVAATVTSLRNLGLGDPAIAANITGIVNQRLLRTLCTSCKKKTSISNEQKAAFEKFGLTIPESLYEPAGCSICSGTGYRGRVGVFEVATLDPSIREIIQSAATQDQIAAHLRANHVPDLCSDGLSKAADGLITVEDALSIRWLS
jgi:type II secretory ATPase GspE/PulE/Tfp pilus assembly ATPase PilB-like protein/nucleotide-binding universal stress UspA family protein